jgi:hypothetical protein
MISLKIKEENMKLYRIGLTVLLLLAAVTFWLANKANEKKPNFKRETRNIASADSSTVMLEEIVVVAERPKKTTDTAANAKQNEITFPEIVVTAPRPQLIPKEITVIGKRPIRTNKTKQVISSPFDGSYGSGYPYWSLNGRFNRPGWNIGRGNLFKPDFKMRENNYYGEPSNYPWTLNLD